MRLHFDRPTSIDKANIGVLKCIQHVTDNYTGDRASHVMWRNQKLTTIPLTKTFHVTKNSNKTTDKYNIRKCCTILDHGRYIYIYTHTFLTTPRYPPHQHHISSIPPWEAYIGRDGENQANVGKMTLFIERLINCVKIHVCSRTRLPQRTV